MKNQEKNAKSDKTDYQQDRTEYIYCSAIGQDSHRFVTDEAFSKEPDRPLILGGLTIPDVRPLAGNSDADVLLHALTNAVSGLTGVNILGAIADKMCSEQGITDSRVYLQESLRYLDDWQLLHISFTVEAKKPRLAEWIVPIREKIATLTGLQSAQIGLTATSGEGMTAFGCGQGMMAFCLVSARRPV